MCFIVAGRMLQVTGSLGFFNLHASPSEIEWRMVIPNPQPYCLKLKISRWGEESQEIDLLRVCLLKFCVGRMRVTSYVLRVAGCGVRFCYNINIIVSYF